MPEGDTIYRTATTLRRWLGGRQVTSARTTAPNVGLGVLVGDTVADVEPRAKHLLIRFGSGRILHTHMRMTGSWHVYTSGERWHRPSSQARIVLETGERLAVCFSAPVIELLVPGGDRLHPVLAALGPDVLVEPLDVGEVRQRVLHQPGSQEIGDVLLDQRVASGIGNIYRCEALFLDGIHPRRSLDEVGADAVVHAVESAARLMKTGAGSTAAAQARPPLDARRPPLTGGRWVYDRAGRPCRRCGEPIRSGRVGSQARTAYWCPRCQPPP
jgi:endonuclease VIII